MLTDGSGPHPNTWRHAFLRTFADHSPAERLTSTVAFVAPQPHTNKHVFLNEEWGDGSKHRSPRSSSDQRSPHPEGEHWSWPRWWVKTPMSPTSLPFEGTATVVGRQVDQVHLTTATVRHALPHIDRGHHQRFFPTSR